MRRIAAAVLLALAGMAVWASVAFAHRHRAETSAAIYDPDPSHIWNRLHAVLFVREDLPDTRLVPDALDPPLWYNTRYLLAEPSHRRALRILDEFLRRHAENLIHDPLKRALLQRDLWSVFDWSIERVPEGNRGPPYDAEKRELQARLAEVMRRIALSSDEIRTLPNNYEQAVASGEFATEYDPNLKDRAFLPPDLFDARGPWVELEGPGDIQPVAEQHFSYFFGRSSFLIFIRFPQGRKAAFDYLEKLWNFPQPTVPSPNFAPGQDVAPNPKLPQFPAGTQFALVRQMTLFDNQGQLVLTPITESVQIRVYGNVSAEDDLGAVANGFDEEIARSGQTFYEIMLSRPQLFAHKAGGLRATGRDEKQYFIFNFMGPDEGRPPYNASLEGSTPALKECVVCHANKGLNSVRSRVRLLKPHELQRDRSHDADGPAWWQDPRTIPWKQGQDDWALLNQYWKGASAAR